jgi:hypothetical protein
MTYNCLTSFRASEALETIAPDNLDQSILVMSCVGVESLLKLCIKPFSAKASSKSETYSFFASFRAPDARETIVSDNLDHSIAGMSGWDIESLLKSVHQAHL